ncbi:MAG: PorT family protein [Proteobacteria bacterium]|nr:PorT family protein [Pseudomonadota bacterium]
MYLTKFLRLAVLLATLYPADANGQAPASPSQQESPDTARQDDCARSPSRSQRSDERSNDENPNDRRVIHNSRSRVERGSEAANSKQRRRLVVGGKVGLNIATLGGPDADRSSPDGQTRVESTYSLGVVIDAFARLPIIEPWTIQFGVQPEFTFSSKGTGVEVNGTERSDFDYSYLELAVLAHGRRAFSSTRNRVSIHGIVGPSVGCLLEARQGERVFTDEAKRIDMGLHGGVGLSVSLPYGAVVLEARYYYGLTGLNKESASTNDIRHRTISILLGYEMALPFARAQ